MARKKTTIRVSEEELLDLVLSLSRTERAYIKNFIARNKNAKYLNLLDWIVNKKNYSRTKYIKSLGIIDQKLQNEERKRLLSLEENLIQNIYKALRSVHASQSILTLLSNYMSEADILKTKGLYVLALERLESAEQLAEKYQKYSILVEILPLKAEVILLLRERQRREQIDAIYTNLRRVLLLLQQESLYRYQNINWVLLCQDTKHYKDLPLHANEQLDQLIAEGFPEQGTFYAQYYYHSMQALRGKVFRNFTEARIQQERVITIWDSPQYQAIKKHALKHYIVQLSNLINNAIGEKNYDIAHNALERIGALTPKSLDSEAEQKQDELYGQQMLYLNLEKFKEAYALVAKSETILDKYDTQINPSRKRSIYYNNVLASFLMGAYVKADQWLKRTQTLCHKYKLREDIQHFLHLLRLVIYYSMNSPHFTPSVIETLEQHSNSSLTKEDSDNLVKKIERLDVKKPIKPQMTTFENILFIFLKKLLKAAPGKGQQVLFEQFNDEMNALLPKERTFGFGEIQYWVQQNLKKHQRPSW